MNDLRTDFVHTLTSRLELILPIRSGYKLTEVELNAQFILTTNIFLANCKAPTEPGTRSFMLFVVESLVGMMERLNIDPQTRLIRERDDRTLTLTLVLTKLLSVLVRFSWDRSRIFKHLDHVNTSGINFNYDLGSPINCLTLYSQPEPDSLDVDMHHTLDVLLSLHSEDHNRRALAHIRRSDKPRHETNYHLAPLELPVAVARKYAAEIDMHILVVVRYLAVSNANDYYLFVARRLFAYLERGEYIPTKALQKYACMVKYVYYTADTTNAYLEQVYRMLPYVQSNTWKQIFLYYKSLNLQTQSVHRPHFYAEVICAGGAAEQSCKLLFDLVMTVFEDPHEVDPSVLTWYVLTCPSDFDAVLQKPNKLKQTFNKRVKYLTGLLKDLQAGASLDCFESLIDIFLLGSRIPNVTGGVREFSLRYLDQTYNNLRNMRARCLNLDSVQRYIKLIVDFFIAAIAMNPDHYIGEFIDLYHKYTNLSANDCGSGCLCCYARLSVKVVRGLSEYPHYRAFFAATIGKLHKTMRKMLFDACSILSQYELMHQHKDTTSPAFRPVDKDSTEVNKPILRPSSHPLKKNLDYNIGYVGDIPSEDHSDLTDTSVLSSPLQPRPHSHVEIHLNHDLECIKIVEEILGDLMTIFAAAPEYYMLSANTDWTSEPPPDYDLTDFAEEISTPIKQAILFNSVNGNSNLLYAAGDLAMTLVNKDKLELRDTPLKECTTFVLCLHVVKAVAEACTLFSLTDPKFKLCFIFLNRFLQERELSFHSCRENKFVASKWAHAFCSGTCEAVETILMLALCTHDVQFFGISKITMSWYLLEINGDMHLNGCIAHTLSDTFKRIMDDDSVFTGLVSLHKRFRNILMDAEPIPSLYHVWILIYQRWSVMIEQSSNVGDKNLVFRHYTGFLVSTSGCFLDLRFSKDDLKEKEKALSLVSAFFDSAIALLKSSELVTRVVVKDALSNESHSAVFHLVCNKLMNVAVYYIEQDQISDEGVLYIEQLMTIITAMVLIENDGSFALVALLPEVCKFLLKFISMVDNPVDQLKLKLRFCKLGHAVEGDTVTNGISGAYKLRNMYAKASAEWLEQAIFYKLDESGSTSDLPSILSSPLTTTPLHHKASETDYLQVELSNECSKCLELQLLGLILEVPEGTKEKNVKQSKELIFSNYFSLFYKIIQKHASVIQSPAMIRSRYKVQAVTDNVLKSISNILQSDPEIGMQLVLPLGFHENTKIRSIFLNIFASILCSRKNFKKKEEFPDEIVERMSEVYEIYGAAAEVASPAEYNLLATSLLGLFGYTMRLDKLFITLLRDEIGDVARSSDIFRRNSTLTRLMSLFAKEYGLPYLTVVLKPFIEELVEDEFIVEVEKSSDEQNVNMFLATLTKLVDTIVNSVEWVPDSFKLIVTEIYKCIKSKFEHAALIAVGSFIFLRFFCPALISPESFFDMHHIHPKVKRSLMQLVKVLQYIANGSLGMLKWPGLQARSQELEELNRKLFNFLSVLAHSPNEEDYPFHRLTLKPYTSLRYLHKFLYVYFVNIKHRYILSDPLVTTGNLHKRILLWRKMDALLKDLGNPKPYISLHGTSSYKPADLANNMGNTQYAEFMAKMSAKNIEMAVDIPVIHSAVFHDGTPVVVVNFRYIKDIGYDISTFVYLILDAASQVWENSFYIVNDFTEFFYMGIIGRNYVGLMRNYAPAIFFKNCARSYYFNLPRAKYLPMIQNLVSMRIDEYNKEGKVYFYSQEDDPKTIGKLCLEESVVAINHDVRMVFNDCLLYDENSQLLTPVKIKLGRQWLQICSKKSKFDEYYTVTKTLTPVETHLLSDLTKCEISYRSEKQNEFTISLNKYNYEVTIISPQRSEILRFLYFAMLRNAKKPVNLKTPEDENEEQSQWFGRLYNIVFHGLLESDEDVRAASSNLFASLSTYFDIDFGISSAHAKLIAYPVDTTEFVVSVSTYLSKELPERTFRFLKAFFSNFLRLPVGLRVSGIMYASPWIDNVGKKVFGDLEGPAKVGEIIRQFSRITVLNKAILSFINEYVWKKLFSELRLTSILMEELIAYAIENTTDNSEWDAIISVISPSVELSGEVTARLNNCIRNTKKNDSEIGLQTKLLEITVLVKVCASLFFNSYVYGMLYLLDVFFFCTLFIDSPTLEFGSDLQKLVINTIQSFNHKPGLTEKQSKLINDTVVYFSGQRARMLFGLTSRERGLNSDYDQHFNRSSSFEFLCDHLNDFILQMGSADDRTKWITRWSSLSMDVAFSDSLYQKRALLAVCTLARSGISDSTAGRILKLFGKIMFDDFESYVNAGICYARIGEGLSRESFYLPLIIWSQILSAMIRISSSYQAIATCLTNCLCKVSDDADYLDYVYEQRVKLEPLIDRFEGEMNKKVTKANFEFAIMFVVCTGLTVSQFRHTSISCLKKLMTRKFGVDKPENTARGKLDYCYLFMFYLALLNTGFLEFAEDIDLESSTLITIGKDQIPSIIVETLVNDSGLSKLTLVLAACVFAKDADSVYSLRFINFYLYLFKVARKYALLVFHIVKGGLEANMVNSTSITLVNELSDLLVHVILDNEYSSEKCLAEIDEILVQFNLGCMDTIGNFNGSGSDVLENKSTLTLAKLSQDMLYRSFCGVIEEQRLEGF